MLFVPRFKYSRRQKDSDHLMPVSWAKQQLVRTQLKTHSSPLMPSAVWTSPKQSSVSNQCWILYYTSWLTMHNFVYLVSMSLPFLFVRCYRVPAVLFIPHPLVITSCFFSRNKALQVWHMAYIWMHSENHIIVWRQRGQVREQLLNSWNISGLACGCREEGGENERRGELVEEEEG